MRLTQAAFERRHIDLMPAGVAALLREGHRERIGVTEPGNGSPWAVANRWLSAEACELKGAQVQRAFDEEAIRDCAENYSRLCGRMHSLESRMSFAVSMGIEPPAGKSITPCGTAARLDSPVWWRRQLRKRWTRAAENSMRGLGVVRKGREPYASNEAVRHRKAQKRRGREFLESSVAVNEAGEQLALWGLAQKSLANPAIRRGEFMTRVRGFEEIAKDHGHVAEFATLTAPGHFHAQLADGGRNPGYQRAVVREAQAWLCKMWARARAKLRRLSVLMYGFRVAEPHHDGTPHWHMLLFVPAHHRETLRQVLCGVWLSDFPVPRGSEHVRCLIADIEPSRGSAAGYVAKYVAKNIDAAGEIGDAEDFETGGTVRDGVVRVDSWASIHGIRQFQQLGGPPIGLWREFRRLREPVGDRDMERCRAAADAGDFRGFVDAVGGIEAGRRTNPRLHKEDTGTVNRYGEQRPACIVGVRYASALEITRPHRWRIEKAESCSNRSEGRGSSRDSRDSGQSRARPERHGSSSSILSPLGPVAITVRAAPEPLDPRYAWIATIPFRISARAGPQ